MNKQFTFRGMDHSNTIQEYADEQLQKIEKFLSNEKEPIYIHVIVTAHPNHAHHEAEINVTSPLLNCSIKREAPDLYRAISETFDIAYDKLTEDKRKLVDHWHSGIKKQ